MAATAIEQGQCMLVLFSAVLRHTNQTTGLKIKECNQAEVRGIWRASGTALTISMTEVYCIHGCPR